jgi:hypothetical protein
MTFVNDPKTAWRVLGVFERRAFDSPSVAALVKPSGNAAARTKGQYTRGIGSPHR